MYTSWLGTLPDEALSIYVHIPFCRKLCWYCGCHTQISNRYSPIESYTRLLKREIKLVSAALGKRHSVSQIHFGGGSPTALLPEDFEGIMAVLKDHFDLGEDAQVAIEIDPRTLTEPKVAAYAKSGVTRASIGVQDFNKEVQEAINRVQPFHVVYDSIKMLRDYGINHISTDLIYGLPYQTVERIRRNIDYTLLMEPDRIALFGYAHVPWKKKHMRMIDEVTLPDGLTRVNMLSMATSQLREAGYVDIGIDHFVRQGDAIHQAFLSHRLHRNFQGYEAGGADSIIGLGVSAISTLPQGYVQNTLGQDHYKKAIIANSLPTIKGIAVCKEDRLRRDIINTLMCYMTVAVDKICVEHGFSPCMFDAVLEGLGPLKTDGLITMDAYTITVSPSARQIARLVCSRFDSYLQDVVNKHSRIA